LSATMWQVSMAVAGASHIFHTQLINHTVFTF
jgi:hypothetical protein